MSVLWPAKPHTLAKIEIVKNYLEAWIPIVGRGQRIVYIDGFCGPGEYEGGELGSPIVALRTALNHEHIDKVYEMLFVFVDKEPAYIEHLDGLLQECERPSNVNVMAKAARFEEIMSEILDYLEKKGTQMAPTFLFVDPFGIRGVSANLLKRFMLNPRCEILLTFMMESVNRFKEHPYFEAHLTKLFGSSDWKECLESGSSKEKDECLVVRFEDTLDEMCSYHWRFSVVDERNKRVYFLYFGTNSILGLEKMKDAMYKVEPSGTFTFRTRTRGQMALFDIDTDENFIAGLRQQMLAELAGQQVPIEVLEDFVVAKTVYRKAHTKRTLQRMEDEGEIQIVSSPRQRARSYPDGTIIKIQDG